MKFHFSHASVVSKLFAEESCWCRKELRRRRNPALYGVALTLTPSPITSQCTNKIILKLLF